MKTARCLLECGADVKAQDKDEETPLHVASKCGYYGQPEVARLLIEYSSGQGWPDSNAPGVMVMESENRFRAYREWRGCVGLGQVRPGSNAPGVKCREPEDHSCAYRGWCGRVGSG